MRDEPRSYGSFTFAPAPLGVVAQVRATGTCSAATLEAAASHDPPPSGAEAGRGDGDGPTRAERGLPAAPSSCLPERHTAIARWSSLFLSHFPRLTAISSCSVRLSTVVLAQPPPTLLDSSRTYLPHSSSLDCTHSPLAIMSDARPAREATIPLGYTDTHGGFEHSATTAIYRECPGVSWRPTRSRSGAEMDGAMAVAVFKLSEGPAIEPAAIKAAAERVARKWRVYAGRAVTDNEVSLGSAALRASGFCAMQAICMTNLHPLTGLWFGRAARRARL